MTARGSASRAAEEISLSSAPELLPATLSQRTSRIRLGHAAVLAPSEINHPRRVAERAAWLDQLSGGRVELGLTRSTAPEWRMFGVDPASARAQTQQAFEEVPRLWTGAGDRPLVPGPLKHPHPPLGRRPPVRRPTRKRADGAWASWARPSGAPDPGSPPGGALPGVGSIPHDRVMDSIRRVGELIPEFA